MEPSPCSSAVFPWLFRSQCRQEQLKKLWTQGSNEFEEIYGLPFSEVKADLEKAVLEKYPLSPEIDWQEFEKGCK